MKKVEYCVQYQREGETEWTSMSPSPYWLGAVKQLLRLSVQARTFSHRLVKSEIILEVPADERIGKEK